MAREEQEHFPPEAQRGVCVFCGTREVTRQHVWPRWLQKVMETDKKGPILHVADDERSDAQPRVWRAPAFELTVRRVCGKCNHGWMSALENDAQPLLTPMILGRSKTLDRDEQAVVASWAMMTLMMFEWTRPEKQTIPEAHYRILYQTKLPPHDVSLSLAAHRVPGYVAIYDHDAKWFGDTLAEPERVNSYGVGLVIGQLVIDGFSLFGTPGRQVRHARRTRLRSIWPSGATIRWPPPISLTRRDFEVIGLV